MQIQRMCGPFYKLSKENYLIHTFIPDLPQEVAIPEKGILSTIIRKDDHVNVTLFAFAAREELTAHSAPTPAVLYFLEGEAEVQLGSETVHARSGSFIYMPPMLPHGIAANTAVKMLLVQVKVNLPKTNIQAGSEIPEPIT